MTTEAPDYIDIWTAVLDKHQAHGLRSLSEPERIVFVIDCFLIDLENGGLTGALYNASSRLDVIGGAFAAAGDQETVSVLREIASLIDGPSATKTWEEHLHMTHADNEFPRWELALLRRRLYRVLEHFTAAHLSELPKSTGAT